MPAQFLRIQQFEPPDFQGFLSRVCSGHSAVELVWLHCRLGSALWSVFSVAIPLGKSRRTQENHCRGFRVRANADFVNGVSFLRLPAGVKECFDLLSSSVTPQLSG